MIHILNRASGERPIQLASWVMYDFNVPLKSRSFLWIELYSVAEAVPAGRCSVSEYPTWLKFSDLHDMFSSDQESRSR